MKRIAVIAHGLHWKKWSERRLFESHASSHIIDYYITEGPDDASRFAYQCSVQSYDVIVSYGGDGTLHQVVQGMMRSRLPADILPKLAILPRGSGNDFVRTIPTCRKVSELWGLLQADHFQYTDVGQVEIEGEGRPQYFLNIADAGLGGDVAQRIGKFRLGWSARAMYHWAIVRSLLSYRAVETEVILDGHRWTGKALSVVVANGRYFGSGLGIAPEADVSDGLFELIILGDISIPEYLIYLKQLRQCRRIVHPEVHYFKTTQVSIRSTQLPLPLECDGEVYPPTPATFRCLKHRLRYLVYRNEAESI